jgi:hypothetical protein
MSNFSKGKYAQFISDRSGMAFPYKQMVKEWNGSRVDVSEFEAKQPQLEPKPHGADPQGLPMAKPDRTEPAVLILLNPNPFTTIIYSSTTYINVYLQNHGLTTGTTVRFRGPTSPTGFQNVPSFDGVTNISNANGFTIVVGKINSSGNISDTANYFHFTGAGTAIAGNVEGGGSGCTSGPVTLQA